MSDCSAVKTYVDGEGAEMMGCWRCHGRINRCPLLGSTPWRHQIKLHDVFFPVVVNVPASGPPVDPGTRKDIRRCSGSSPLHTDFSPHINT